VVLGLVLVLFEQPDEALFAYACPYSSLQ